RQLNSLQNTWPYGYSMPIAVRYTQDAFSRSGWLWPVDAKGEPLKATSYMAVGFYVAKYFPKHLFQGYLNIYNNYFKAPWMPDRTEANPNELNQDDARYGFRCCHLKNIWTAP